jgi:hypothetical protein
VAIATLCVALWPNLAKHSHNCVAELGTKNGKSERQPTTTPTVSSQQPTTDTPQPGPKQHPPTSTPDKQQWALDKQCSTTNDKQLATIDTPNQHNKHATKDKGTVENAKNSAISTDTPESHPDDTVFRENFHANHHTLSVFVFRTLVTNLKPATTERQRCYVFFSSIM